MKQSTKVIGQFNPELELLDYLLDEDGISAGDQKICRRKNLEELPLSFAQKRLWLLDRLESGAHYNDHFDLRLEGPLQVLALQRSLNEIVRRHEVLRARFLVREGEPIQQITPPSGVPLPCIDLGSFPDSKRMAEAMRLAVEAGSIPFDLQQGPLLRTSLLRLNANEHILILTVHHIAIDGWSRSVFLNELTALYQAFVDGQPSPLPELSIQYADFALWQQQRIGDEVLVKQLDYWKQQLAGAPALQEWPATFPRPEIQSFRGARQPIFIPKPLTEALKNLSQQEGCTLFMTLLAAFQTLAARYTRQEDIVVGSPIANRNRAEIEGLIGCFLNTLVLRTDLSGNPTFRQLMARTREVALAAYAHQDVPYEKLVEELHPTRNQGHNPLFQVMFVFQNIPVPVLKTKDLNISAFEFDGGVAKFDLTFNLMETPEGISGWIEYATGLFDRAAIIRMQGHYQILLEAVIANPDQLISSLPILTASERQQLLETWNNTRTDHPASQCVQQLFAKQAALTPEARAVVLGREHLTYRELNERSNQLSSYLRKCGVGPNVLVGISVERSLEMVVGILGILKAGGAYVPLDPAYPQERLAFMLQDARAPVLLTQKKLVEKLLATQARIFCLDSEWETVATESRENPASASSPDNLIYVIYTSGSTGRPKGAGVYHRGFTNLMHWFVSEFAITSRDNVLLVSSLSFDLTQKNIYATLMRGGQLHLLPTGPYDPGLIARLVREHQITLLNCTPSAFYPLIEPASAMAFQNVSSLRSVFLGGEPISIPRLRPWLESETCHAEVDNTYGPTECTDICAFYRMNRANLDRFDFVPVGRPVYNVQLAIVNPDMTPCPVGVAGELCVGGAGVGIGYLNDAAMTAAKFVNNPFPEIPGKQIYKTGDLARYLPDGNIEFLGRMDHQVKIRGFRIELHEIEGVLTGHEAIRESIVIVRNATGGSGNAAADPTLVAYYVSKNGTLPEVSELRQYLKQKLPEYMVPAMFVHLEKFPLSPNGKVDRRALPEPEALRTDSKFAPVLPQTQTEQIIVRIWQEALHTQRVGLDDNFFDLGGNSLQLAQVHVQLREQLKVDLAITTLFEFTTVAALAKHLGARSEQSNSSQQFQDRARRQQQVLARQRQLIKGK
ncbi:MAG: non-ribosomal peptide synthetase [Pedosphaera sp.]|nr:non-ribosomal peptide synthetase [Pedosphaera sp.]